MSEKSVFRGLMLGYQKRKMAEKPQKRAKNGKESC